MQHQQTRRNRTRPVRHTGAVEPLEARTLMYALAGMEWVNTDVSYSLVPDGTSIDGYTSQLFSQLNKTYASEMWQREFARALQTWANVTNVNFHQVADDGSPRGAYGLVQGDGRFGDVRLSTSDLGSNVLGSASFPNIGTTGSTEGGDISINSLRTYFIGATPDLYSVLLHESGHALGLDHSVSGTVMYGATTGIWSGLTADDVAGIQAIYGARRPDAYDAAAANDGLATASALAMGSTTLSFRADLTSLADVDYYRLTVPAGAGGTATFTVDARGLSLLAPKVLVYDASGNLVGSASAGQAYGSSATVTLSGVVAGQTYYVVADGATADAFGMGAYKLGVQFSDAPVPAPAPAPAPPPAAPTDLLAAAASASEIDLTWADRSGDEQGFRVEQSADGVNFTPAGTAAANATTFRLTGLAAATAYTFRVQAFNASGASAWTNLAQATTQPLPAPQPAPEPAPAPAPPPAPALSPDRFEANDAIAQASYLGVGNSISQLGLTVHSATDVDFYSFSVKKGGTFALSTRFANAAGNLDLYLYTATGALVASATTTGDGESLRLKLGDNRRYLVRVASPDGGTNTYDLAIAKSSAGTGGLTTETNGSPRKKPRHRHRSSLVTTL